MSTSYLEWLLTMIIWNDYLARIATKNYSENKNSRSTEISLVYTIMN